MRSRACFASRIDLAWVTLRIQKFALTFSSEERDGGTMSTSATSTANAMDVVFRVVRVIVVQDMSNVPNI